MIFRRKDFIQSTRLSPFFILLVLTDIKYFTNGHVFSPRTNNNVPEMFINQENTSKPTDYAKLKGMIDTLTTFSNQISKQAKLVTKAVTNQQESETPFPLAIPIGETVRKDRLNQNKTKINLEKAQHWRFKLVPGTDRHLEEILIGKCWDYQNKLNVLKKKVDCERLWEAFIAGFAYKEPCDVTLGDYDEFFNLIGEDPLVNKSILWSGARDITHELSYFNVRFTALEDTFAGFLLDGMQWCGMTKEPGINYNKCPYECAKQKAFWGAAAKKMAQRSEGIVYAVINGTRQHWNDKQIFSAYMMDSYMARNQIPNLDPRKVKEVRIMVGHSLHQKVLERCGTFSVKELQKQIELRGIKTSCVDDPLSVRALLCLDYPRDPLCQFHLTTLLDER